jgi:hypothetical protein
MQVLCLPFLPPPGGFFVSAPVGVRASLMGETGADGHQPDQPGAFRFSLVSSQSPEIIGLSILCSDGTGVAFENLNKWSIKDRRKSSVLKGETQWHYEHAQPSVARS